MGTGSTTLLTALAIALTGVLSGCSSDDAEAETESAFTATETYDEADFASDDETSDDLEDEDLWAEEDEESESDDELDWGDEEDEEDYEDAPEFGGDYDIDQYLDDYEAYLLKLVDVMDRMADNDPSAIQEYMEALQDAQEISEKLNGLQGQMEPRHLERFMEMQQKLQAASAKLGQ